MRLRQLENRYQRHYTQGSACLPKIAEANRTRTKLTDPHPGMRPNGVRRLRREDIFFEDGSESRLPTVAMYIRIEFLVETGRRSEYNEIPMFPFQRRVIPKGPDRSRAGSLSRACARDRDNSVLWAEFLRRYGAKIRQFIRGTWRIPAQSRSCVASRKTICFRRR